jgi:hydroxyacylglutathione hydrolase
MQEKRFGPVLFIPGQNKGKYPYCNSIYIEKAGILIDPSSDMDRLIRLRNEERIEQVWLTHFHEDHIMHLDLFDGIPLLMSKEDAVMLSSIESFMDWEWFEPDEDTRKFWTGMLKEQFNFRPRKPSGFLKGGDIFEKNGITIEVIHTPGHTPGNLSFYIREAGVLFIGDYDLSDFGPYYGDRNSSIKETIASINSLRQISAKIILTGHEEGIFENPADAVWERYVGVISKRESALLEFLISPRSMQEIVNAHIVYGRQREPKSFFETGERAIMKKHIELLLENNLITRDGEFYKRKYRAVEEKH